MLFPFLASFIIYDPRASITSFTSGCIFPCKNSIASITSNEFPTAFPKGSSMLVTTQTVSLLASSPIFFMVSASLVALSTSFINAPFPHVTSRTILFAPAAIFLLIMLDAISGILSVVDVVSLKAYSFLSAGAKFNVWPIKAIPISFTFWINWSIVRLVLYPGIDSNLSIVPPVYPNPLPDIFATGISSDAIIGAKISVTLSPIPPVLCLSTTVPNSDKSRISPECAIAKVKFVVSSSSIPFK